MTYSKNKDFFEKDKDGSLVFDVQRDEQGGYVVETKPDDPATLLVKDENDPTWLKHEFYKLAKDDCDANFITEAQKRFGINKDAILQHKRTIGVSSIVALVFDNDEVRFVAVQRTAQNNGATNQGMLSRFGGGACGGTVEGVHGSQNLANQTAKELLEEMHVYVQKDDKTVAPLDLVIEGHEIDNTLTGQFMQAVYTDRASIAQKIEENFLKEEWGVEATKTTLVARTLVIDGITQPFTQKIDGQEIVHKVVPLDAYPINKNLDFYLDTIFAIRIEGMKASDIIIKDGETDANTGKLLDRTIRLETSAEMSKLLDQPDLIKFSPPFKALMGQADKIAGAAREKYSQPAVL
jgi:hypothetical protein